MDEITPQRPLLIGVFPADRQQLEDMPDGASSGFVYSVTRDDVNLWCSGTLTDGTHANLELVGMGLNGLFGEGKVAEGDWYEIRADNPDGTPGSVLRWTVGEEVDKRSVQAFQALTDSVRVVRISDRTKEGGDG